MDVGYPPFINIDFGRIIFIGCRGMGVARDPEKDLGILQKSIGGDFLQAGLQSWAYLHVYYSLSVSREEERGKRRW